jgi:Mn-dependent DtxR family transcriptional regulator
MVIAYLNSQGYMGVPVELRYKVGSAVLDKIAGELEMQDNMVTSLAELLEERGMIDYHEWENRIKKKLVKQK